MATETDSSQCAKLQTNDDEQKAFDVQQAKKHATDQVEAQLELAIRDIADRSFAKAGEQLEEVMKEALRMHCEELRAEIAESNRALWGRLSELPSRGHVHRFVKCQVAMKEQLDLVTQAVCTVAESQGSKTVCTIARPNGIGDVTSSEHSQLEAKCEVLCKQVRALLADISMETEKLQAATARCESAKSAVDAVHQQVVWQCEETTKRISVLEQSRCDQHPCMSKCPSKEDMKQMLDACRAVRLDDAHAEQQIGDLRANIAAMSERLDSVCKKCSEFHEAYQGRLNACLKVQKELRTDVSSLLQERHRYSQAMITPDLTALQDMLQASQAEHKKSFEAEHRKIFAVVEALTSSSESLVASI